MIFFSSFFPPKFCDFFIVLNFYIVYSNTLYCTHNVYIKKILTFRYNRCQDTLHTDDQTMKEDEFLQKTIIILQ